jgi:superfamily I DNA/RNA helicase
MTATLAEPKAFKPTNEQLDIVDESRKGESLSVIARAGTGKTTTAKAIALDQPLRRFLYLAFGKKNAASAREKFPQNTTVSTAHALAYKAVGRHYKDRIVRSPYRLKMELADRFTAAWSDLGGSRETESLAFIAAIDTINSFCASADVDIDDETHVPEGNFERDLIGPIARGMWDAMVNTSDTAPITDDVYLKLYQLQIALGQTQQQTLGADMILFDEAQDSSACMLDICLRSRIPIVLIGDPRQSIYQWRGSIDAFSHVDFPELALTNSWRFGPEIAAPANDILTVLSEYHLINGKGEPGKVVVDDDSIFPSAIVARTNTGLVSEAVRIVDDKGTIHIVGSHEQTFAWLRSAYELYDTNQSRHPAFAMFRSWEALTTASNEKIGRNYKPFVTLVEQYRRDVPALLERLEQATLPANVADTVLSTVHRFKGEEAAYVKLADDFAAFCTVNTEPKGAPFVLDEQEANLAYVAVTRARKQLDLGGFASTLRESLKFAHELIKWQYPPERPF